MVSRESERVLGRLFKHDVGNALNIAQHSLRRDNDVDVLGVEDLGLSGEEFDSVSDVGKDEISSIGTNSEFGAFVEFVEIAEEAHDTLAEAEEYYLDEISDELQSLRDFDENRISQTESVGENTPRDYVEQVSGLAEAVEDYVNQISETTEYSNISAEEIFETFENYGEVDYGGLKESSVEGDGALCVVANTIALNAMEHGENPELYAELEEIEDKYKIDIWDDGEGLSESYDPEDIFSKGTGDNSGLGLYIAREITKGFGGSLNYSEENAEREDGFGLQWELNKPGGQDSEDVKTEDRYPIT
jgi:signal transduction histidine kinase